MSADRIDVGGVTIPADSYRATMAAERQRDIDARMAAWYSTSTELAAFNVADVLEAGKRAY